MADWQKLLTNVLLADGVIDASETAMLKEEILEDGKVDEQEIEFLVNLRNSATSAGKEFELFFFEALKRNILDDGIVDVKETERLRDIIFADKVVDENEKTFLKELKMEAKNVCPEFEALLSECLAK